MPDPARVSEQRSHVASTRSAATGCRRVGCRDSSATRSLLAGLEPSGSLVIHGDAPAPDRQGGLLLPLATGPDELRERPPRVAVQERDRAFRGQLALASETHARAARCRSASLRPRRRCPPDGADGGAGRMPRALRRSGRSATPARRSRSLGGPRVDLGLGRLDACCLHPSWHPPTPGPSIRSCPPPPGSVTDSARRVSERRVYASVCGQAKRGTAARQAANRLTAASSRTIPSPGAAGTRRTPSAAGPDRLREHEVAPLGRPAGRVVRKLEERPATDAGRDVRGSRAGRSRWSTYAA